MATTRRLILVEAMRLFAEHGYDGVSVRRIARASDLSTPAIYHFFGNKQKLYDACRDEVFAQGGERLHAAMAAGSRRLPARRLHDFTASLCSQLAADPFLLPFVQHEGLRRSAWIEQPAWRRCIDEAAALVAASQAGISDRQAHDVARAIVGYAIGSAMVEGALPADARRAQASKPAPGRSKGILRSALASLPHAGG